MPLDTKIESVFVTSSFPFSLPC